MDRNSNVQFGPQDFQRVVDLFLHGGFGNGQLSWQNFSNSAN
ncbi:hypothetical protein EDD80_102434 [Anseongella ginsenosidimutans]|uniref:Uncharacterized protein n=1 Tax=Anseongella ginsenosidimutans TaxID=496056 RepID=A0A4R3KXP8_9SPHI|nr:hypothetical protein EDD80_102434 [Anseongella ginsenosidimutans]